MATLQDEYKALTHVNLPFIEKRYEPGETIKTSDIQKYVERANSIVPDRTDEDPKSTPPVTVEGVVAEFSKYGSISADFDAPIHPDNVIPDVNDLTAQSVVASALALAEKLKASGTPLPEEIQAIVDIHKDRTQVSDQDTGRGADRVA